jgi:membrane protein
MTGRVLWELTKSTFHEWNEDKAPRLGAALAYYSVFSIAPLLIVAIGVAGLVFGEQAARGEIIEQIETTVGQPGAQALQDVLLQTQESGTCTLATVVGLALMLFGASGVFVQLQDALNTIWKVAPKPGRALLEIVRDRLLSFSVVLGIGFLLLVSLVISASLSALNKFLTPESLPGGLALWQAINVVTSFALISLFFALLFKLLPDVRIPWRDVWIGAVVTALLFTVGKSLIGLYLGQSSTTSAFGAAASLVIVLLWVYYSAQILLLGAEFTRVYAAYVGSNVRPTSNAMLLAEQPINRVAVTPQRQQNQKASSAVQETTST